MENGDYAVYFKNSKHGEDNYLSRLLSSESIVDAVFDGVSTAGEGSKASLTLRTYLLNAEINKPTDVKNLLTGANINLSNQFMGKALTTATVALKIEDRLYVFNVGDSPAYIFRNGKAIELTTSDSLPENPSVISQSMGIEDKLDIHRKQFKLRQNDRLVLATDGITDNISPDELYECVIKNARNPDVVVNRLESLLLYKKRANIGHVYNFFKNDDQTAIIRFF